MARYGSSEARLDVSRETQARLEIYVDLLRKWQRKINLVSRTTLDEIWTRHVADSLQIWDEADPNAAQWVDIGSGGGFPGLVIAITAAERRPEMQVTLIESDQRKCVFLREVARLTSIKPKIIAERIETAPTQNADILSARALAPLDNLLTYADRHLRDGGLGLFPKGKTYAEELASLPADCQKRIEIVQSRIALDSVVLKYRHARK